MFPVSQTIHEFENNCRVHNTSAPFTGIKKRVLATVAREPILSTPFQAFFLSTQRNASRAQPVISFRRNISANRTILCEHGSSSKFLFCRNDRRQLAIENELLAFTASFWTAKFSQEPRARQHPGVTVRSAGRWFANYLNLPKPQPRRPREPQLPSSVATFAPLSPQFQLFPIPPATILFPRPPFAALSPRIYSLSLSLSLVALTSREFSNYIPSLRRRNLWPQTLASRERHYRVLCY